MAHPSRPPTDRPPFKRPSDFKTQYEGSCYCGTIRWDIGGDPLDSMYCHCETCQTLHGTPYQWASVVRKEHVAFHNGCAEKLVAYHSPTKSNEYTLPCKLSCPDCHAPVMDEGRNMMLLLPPYIHFPREGSDDHPTDAGDVAKQSKEARVAPKRADSETSADASPEEGGGLGRKIVPEPWKANHHMFYGSRCADMADGLVKWLGRKGEKQCDDQGRPITTESAEDKESAAAHNTKHGI
ncbi:hypothetical protein PYCC9005_003111 [Savitreella phatthalungensis]